MWRVAIDAHQEPCLAAIDLYRLRPGGRRDDLARVQSLEHPADRRLSIRSSIQVYGTGHDQPVDRASHRDVVEAQSLLALLRALGLPDVLVVEHRLPVSARRMNHPESEPSVGERNDLVAPARTAGVTPRVRDDHDLEL